MSRRHKHIFAFYAQDLSLSILEDGSVCLNDKNLWQRIIRVTKLDHHDAFILFNRETNLELQLLKETFERKNKVFAKIINKKKNLLPDLNLILYMPITKKSYAENILYNSAQIGVTKIIPVVIERTCRLNLKFIQNIQRVEKILISACEQSKNFCIPELCDPIPLGSVEFSDGIQESFKILLDHEGKSCRKLFERLSQNVPATISVACGPEEGFNSEEKIFLENAGFERFRLVKNILRTQEAVTIALGIVKSLIC